MSDDDLHVTITWRRARRPEDWDERRCVYAYIDPAATDDDDAIVYIGQADWQSVRERWNGHETDGLLDELKNDHGVPEPIVLVGTIDVVDGTRLTEELLDDIEGLLIRFFEPVGNRQYPTMRRDELIITNEGTWTATQVIEAGDEDADDEDEADEDDADENVDDDE